MVADARVVIRIPGRLLTAAERGRPVSFEPVLADVHDITALVDAVGDIATFDPTSGGHRLPAHDMRITRNLVGKVTPAGAADIDRKAEFPTVFLTAGERPVTGDPLLSNPAALDFRLRAGSPAKGAGLSGLRPNSTADLGALPLFKREPSSRPPVMAERGNDGVTNRR